MGLAAGSRSREACLGGGGRTREVERLPVPPSRAARTGSIESGPRPPARLGRDVGWVIDRARVPLDVFGSAGWVRCFRTPKLCAAGGCVMRTDIAATASNPPVVASSHRETAADKRTHAKGNTGRHTSSTSKSMEQLSGFIMRCRRSKQTVLFHSMNTKSAAAS